jgi:hypothetical protein
MSLNPAVPMHLPVGDFAAGEEADERHVTQRMSHQLDLGVGLAGVVPEAAKEPMHSSCHLNAKQLWRILFGLDQSEALG